MVEIITATITGIFGCLFVILQVRATRVTKQVHEEVRTNHGIRQGQRIEDLGTDMEFVRRTMVTKTEFLEHTEQDKNHFAEMTALINARGK